MDREFSLIKFPSNFRLKVIGVLDDNFLDDIFNLVSKFDNNLKKDDILCRVGKNNNYLSLTLNITAISKEQLDNIYMVLNSYDKVKFVL